MEKVTKAHPKKTSSVNASNSRKCQANKKKKKSRKHSNAKDVGKSSTSPEIEVNLSDNPDAGSDTSLSKVHVVDTTVSNRRSSNANEDSARCTHHRKGAQNSHSTPQIGRKESKSKPVKQTDKTNNKTVSNSHSDSGGSKNTLRWENQLSDPEAEEARLKVYKLNRRKRYLAAANHSYSEWARTTSSSPVDKHERKHTAERRQTSVKYPDIKVAVGKNSSAQENIVQDMSSSVKLSLHHHTPQVAQKC